MILTYHATGAPANAFGQLKQIKTQDGSNAVKSRVTYDTYDGLGRVLTDSQVAFTSRSMAISFSSRSISEPGMRGTRRSSKGGCGCDCRQRTYALSNRR